MKTQDILITSNLNTQELQLLANKASVVILKELLRETSTGKVHKYIIYKNRYNFPLNFLVNNIKTPEEIQKMIDIEDLHSKKRADAIMRDMMDSYRNPIELAQQ